jgi:two-component system response regulator ArlR
MPGILICEDEENIVSFLQSELQYEGFLTDVVTDGEQAVQKFSSQAYDLVLLDIMLPKKNGLECLREIRKQSDVPVIILTARKEVYDKVAFLNAGADDYITKPFDTLELIARIKRNIRRTSIESGLNISKDNYQVFFNGTELSLTKTEFEILAFLHENKNKVKTRDEIIHAVFGDFYGESNIIDVNIKNIRAKLRVHTADEVIHTIRGKGYVIRK